MKPKRVVKNTERAGRICLMLARNGAPTIGRTPKGHVALLDGEAYYVNRRSVVVYDYMEFARNNPLPNYTPAA